MIDRTGDQVLKDLGAVGVMGIVAAVCAHFLLGCLKPLIYKGMVLAGCEAQYLAVSDYVDIYSCIVSWMAIFGIYLPHPASICCLLISQAGLKRDKNKSFEGIRD